MGRSSRRSRAGAPPAPIVGSRLEGSRVALRPLCDDDPATLGPWYREVRKDIRSRSNVKLLAITRRGHDAPIGVVGYRVGAVGDVRLGFDFVAVEPGSRGLGLELEAVRLVEGDAVERGGARRLWAGVDGDDGPGLYFWLRLGYRPARRDASPWSRGRRGDIITMTREAGECEESHGRHLPPHR